MIEIWKDIKDYEGLYQVSNFGRVINLKTGKLLTATITKYGYCVVGLYKNGRVKQFRIQRLVAQAFIPNPENKPYVDHINAVRDDNRAENLRWVTPKENSNNPITIKNLSSSQKGEKSYWFGKKGKEHPECKPVLQFDKEGNLIKEWDCIADANRYFNKPRNASQIVRCCNGIRKTGYGYIWKYKN